MTLQNYTTEELTREIEWRTVQAQHGAGHEPEKESKPRRFIGIGGLKTSTATAAMPCTQGIALVVEDESPL
jgi:hypothetical protein